VSIITIPLLLEHGWPVQRPEHVLATGRAGQLPFNPLIKNHDVYLIESFTLAPQCQWLQEANFLLQGELPRGYQTESVCFCLSVLSRHQHSRPKDKGQGLGGSGSRGWELHSLCWCVWYQPTGEHLGPVRLSQRSSLSNCSVSKLRLINCLALSSFKDPRCSAKLMVAVSPLNLTPKQSLENIPDLHSPII
jgi:hypothetical protein